MKVLKNIICIKDEKFKTFAVSVNFYRKLNRNDVTLNALLPAVLRRGCSFYSDTRTINIYLEELYGATLNYDVKKCGDTQIISFYISTISDKYTENDTPFEKSFKLLRDVIFNPYITDNAFSKEYVETEKKNLKELIESVKNDKREYAKKRLIEEMYKNENYGIFEYGYTEDLEKINEQNLYDYYKSFINSTPVKILICGNFDKEKAQETVKDIFTLPEFDIPTINHGIFKSHTETVTETADITQGKLAIGYRTEITKDSSLYFPMLVLNNLFGGSPHSKLFLNVREKLSLAYYAGSGYNSYKGLIIVNCGIEFDKYSLTVKEIDNQLNDILLGNLSEDEINFSKAALTTGYSAINDNLGSQISFYMSQVIGKNIFTISEYIEGINKVTKDDIILAAKTIKPDTIYFLKGENS